ncbi:hypothetical protein EGW08_003669 [Elysia chlorotica]|uniref:Uncharacterized protein n=1 Tax=Elysia chlorotica TaxID=188477 RepID=A0A3S1CC27_ELYCH|nr:hypothetical protein EGW08_003669 [Elysia chlorotica]
MADRQINSTRQPLPKISQVYLKISIGLRVPYQHSQSTDRNQRSKTTFFSLADLARSANNGHIVWLKTVKTKTPTTVYITFEPKMLTYKRGQKREKRKANMK